jgi:hypothetical protein
VVMACRSRSRAAFAAQDIMDDTGNTNVEVRELDLARLASVGLCTSVCGSTKTFCYSAQTR